MAEPATEPKKEVSREERIAAAKERAASRTKEESKPAASSDGEERLDDAAQRFQAVKAGQKVARSRKEREQALLERAVDISPRSSIERLPQAKPVQAESLPINRREFLTYAWGASLALVTVQGSLATLWFTYPRFREGEFGGVFTVTDLTPVGERPGDNLTGKFWWTNTPEGVAALYKVCTHLGCLFEWKNQTNRFECPCHGSKFRQDGRVIHGPATRDLDQFAVTVEDAAGNIVDQTTEERRYVTAQDGLTYKVDTGRKINGRPSDPRLAVEA